jgi:hypothetical protein
VPLSLPVSGSASASVPVSANAYKYSV